MKLGKKLRITKRVRLLIGIIVIGIIFFFMGRALYKNWQQLGVQNLRFNYSFLLLSYLSYGCAILFGNLIWKINLTFLGTKISFRNALRVSVVGNLLRYIPGRVWTVVGKVMLAQKEGIPTKKGGTSIVLQQLLVILSGLILFLFVVTFYQKNVFTNRIYIALIFIPFCLFITYPPVFTRVTNFFLIKFKRKPLRVVPKYTQILMLLCLHFVSWAIQCVGIYFVIKSFYPIKPDLFIPLCGILSGAWIIGFLSFITPGGLGIREGIFSYFLTLYVPTSIGIIIPIVIRIWTIVGEFAFFLLFIRSAKRYV